MAKTITVAADVDAPVEKVWRFYTEPAYITQWNNASPDWHMPKAKNDVKAGGRNSKQSGQKIIPHLWFDVEALKTACKWR